MSSRWSKNGEGDRTLVRHLAEVAMSRRGFGRFVAGAAGMTALTPTLTPSFPSPITRLSPARQESPRGGTLSVAQLSDNETLDPYKANGPLYAVFRNFYDPLTEVNLQNEIEGILAESWEISDDGLEYTFHLRQGINFHDGTPFNADAVKFTFDRVLDPATNATFASWVGPLQEAVVIDDYTVKLVLSEPFSPLLGNIFINWYGIPSPTAVKALGDEFGQRPVGTGPWIFKEWVTGESITLEPNLHYQNPRSYVENKGAPLLDQLVFHVIPEPDTQVAAFETGEVNVILPPPREVQRYQDDPDYEVFIPTGGTGTAYLEFSTTAQPDEAGGALFKPPFDDLRVRQAVGYGIDVDEIITNVMAGLAARNYGPMPIGLFAYEPEIEEFGYHHEPEKAKALLEAAVWADTDGDDVREKDGVPLEVLFWTWSGGPEEKVAQVMQSQLGEVGFKVNVETMDVGVLLARLPENVSHLNYMSYSVPEPDLLRLMVNYGWGLGQYRNKTYETLVTQALKTTDRGERTGLYFEAAKALLADAGMIPLWTPLDVYAIRSSVKNYKVGPIYSLGIYEDVYVEE